VHFPHPNNLDYNFPTPVTPAPQFDVICFYTHIRNTMYPTPLGSSACTPPQLSDVIVCRSHITDNLITYNLRILDLPCQYSPLIFFLPFRSCLYFSERAILASLNLNVDDIYIINDGCVERLRAIVHVVLPPTSQIANLYFFGLILNETVECISRL
jgi:hypothetical protein